MNDNPVAVIAREMFKVDYRMIYWEDQPAYLKGKYFGHALAIIAALEGAGYRVIDARTSGNTITGASAAFVGYGEPSGPNWGNKKAPPPE